jgi:hypothetical protein
MMIRVHSVSAAAVVGWFAYFALACGPVADNQEVAESGQGTTTLTPTTEASGQSGSSAATPGTTTEGTTHGESCGSMCPFSDVPAECDGNPNIRMECDPYLQDCPRGQKCQLWFDRGTWIVHCAPLISRPRGLYESCTADPVSQADDCGAGLVCRDHDYCDELCGCSLDKPTCSDRRSICVQDEYQPYAVCHIECDPQRMDCPLDDVCIDIGNGFYSCRSSP